MALWSTGPPGTAGSIAHAMLEDFHGRPTDPLCGRPLAGLWWRGEATWDQVPEAQRCAECAAALGSPPP